MEKNRGEKLVEVFEEIQRISPFTEVAPGQIERFMEYVKSAEPAETVGMVMTLATLMVALNPDSVIVLVKGVAELQPVVAQALHNLRQQEQPAIPV